MPSSNRKVFLQSAEALACQLLGQHIVRKYESLTLIARIVETEAYLGSEDAAAHSYRGRRTERTEPMFAQGGTSYVYFTYGMHHCFNIVASIQDDPQAVLIRAVEPIEGLDTMMSLRPSAKNPTDIGSGPARLCQALALTREHSSLDLLSKGALQLSWQKTRLIDDQDIESSPRVGIQSAQKHPGGWASRKLRFWIRDNPHVSRPPRSAIIW